MFNAKPWLLASRVAGTSLDFVPHRLDKDKSAERNLRII